MPRGVTKARGFTLLELMWTVGIISVGIVFATQRYAVFHYQSILHNLESLAGGALKALHGAVGYPIAVSTIVAVDENFDGFAQGRRLRPLCNLQPAAKTPPTQRLSRHGGWQSYATSS